MKKKIIVLCLLIFALLTINIISRENSSNLYLPDLGGVYSASFDDIDFSTEITGMLSEGVIDEIAYEEAFAGNNYSGEYKNDLLRWGILRKGFGETPAADPGAPELLEKYGGKYLGDTEKNIIYLTFDEGYENGYTPKILDTLKENDVKAAFFITGPYLTKNADLVKRMLEEGHVVGSHTVNHPSLPDVDNETLEKELYGFEEQFRESFGIGFKYMRPPMGEYSERVLAAASQLGYKTVFWSFAYRDWEVDKQKGPEYAYNMVMGNIHNGAVLLLHAVSKDNAEALDRIIKDVKSQGYEIMPLDL